jgi:hypothetical protein
MSRRLLFAALTTMLAYLGASAAPASGAWSDTPWGDPPSTVAFAAAVPAGYWVDVDESGTTTSGSLGGSGGLSATGTGNVNYGYAQECAPSGDGGPFSIGNYPPATCAQLRRSYNPSGSPEQPSGFWFTGNQNCVNAGRPFSGADFTWHVRLPQTGSWHVETYIPSWTSYGWGDQYILTSADGQFENNPLTQQAYHGQWVNLFGSHQFAANQDYTVDLTGADGADSYCHYQMADEMKWVYDGPSTPTPPAPPPGSPPTLIFAPAVTGLPQVGQVLTCAHGAWAGDTPQTYTYEWLSGGHTVAAASANATYVVNPADEGHDLYCHVVVSNDAGSASAESSAVFVNPVQKDFTSPDFKVVQYIKDFNESGFGPPACIGSLWLGLGISLPFATISCVGLEESHNPDPASNMGGAAWGSLLASKEYRGLVHLPPVTVGCVHGSAQSYSIAGTFEHSGGYTPNIPRILGAYDPGDEYTQAPYAKYYNQPAPEVTVAGANVTVEYLSASRVANSDRKIAYALTHYDAPFIWTELREVVSCSGYAFVPVSSDFPTSVVYENNKRVGEQVQSKDLSDFIASGGYGKYHVPGVGIFDPRCGGPIHEYGSDPGLLPLPVGCGYANIALSLGVHDAAAVHVTTPTVARATLLKRGAATVAVVPPGQGEVLVSWLASLGMSARVGAHAHTPVLVARSRHVTTTGAHRLGMTVRLSTAGRRLLARSRTLNVVEQVMFVDSAGQASHTRRAFVVR